MTLRELHERAEKVAARLVALGVRPGDRIGILAANSLEWVLLDLAALRLKVVTAGFEPGKFTSDTALATRYDLRLIFTDKPDEQLDSLPINEVRTWSETSDGPVAPPPARYSADEPSTIKFTSGSTGTPKGLPASVGSIDSSITAVQEMFAHGPDDDIFIFLPLSLLQQRYWIYSALRYGHDVTVSTYEAAFATLGTARPTVVMGVPGFFDSARRHIEGRATQIAGDPAAARRAAAVKLFGDRIRYLWTGSAPADPDTLRFFTECALPIYEGYGLNETCIVSKNYPGHSRDGSVGRLLPGKQVIVDDDGVVSIRSDHPVSLAYAYAEPGDSERVFGPDGTVRTGDLGYMDADGYLYIRGRADDVIVLGNGRKVIVRPIEEKLKRSPAIEEAVVYCPTETYLVAVVSPATEPADEAAIEEHVDRINTMSAPDERIFRVVIARQRFSIDNDLLTAQFKPKRRRIFQAYRADMVRIQEDSHA
ncbi:long-chain fatty acid--CoA ligase [Micromonospora sp. HNM0581]|nr:long-chain fatty acid--CoA ligase [Micromonospora sp. HNM0581]